jgi:GT2 family glycosyltransferase
MQAVILSYNHPNLTESAMRSVMDHFHDDNIHLVHNGSSIEHVLYLKNQFPSITHHTLENNIGFSGGANFGLQQAFLKDELAFFITNDCELVKIDSNLKKNGLYAPLIMKRKTEHVDSIGGAWSFKTLNLRHLKSSDEALQNHELFYVPGTAFLMHKDFFIKTRGFDESLGTYWEDVDLCLRAQNMGLMLGTDTNFILCHKIGKTCHKDPHYTSYLYLRNQAVITRRYIKNSRALAEAKLLKLHALRSSQHIINRRWLKLRLQLKAYYDSMSV